MPTRERFAYVPWMPSTKWFVSTALVVSPCSRKPKDTKTNFHKKTQSAQAPRRPSRRHFVRVSGPHTDFDQCSTAKHLPCGPKKHTKDSDAWGRGFETTM